MNLVWASWEPTVPPPPAADQEYDGHCFAIAPRSTRPSRTVRPRAGRHGRRLRRARVGPGARLHAVAPRLRDLLRAGDAADYGRFVGMLARRYDGQRPHGRIADFVVHNEVNSNDWFDIGCGQGTACTVATWLDIAESYNAAYDARCEQPSAKVLVSLEHHFGANLDRPAPRPRCSPARPSYRVCDTGRRPRLARRLPPLRAQPALPDFSDPDDFPRSPTATSASSPAGCARLPRPRRRGGAPADRERGQLARALDGGPAGQGVCDALRNVLGTPGIESYIYHRMRDNPVEAASGSALACATRRHGQAGVGDVGAGQPQRSDSAAALLRFRGSAVHPAPAAISASRGHWASSRSLPPGGRCRAHVPAAPGSAPGTHLLYECAVGAHNLLTTDVGCEGQQPLGPVGYAYTNTGERLGAALPLSQHGQRRPLRLQRPRL